MTIDPVHHPYCRLHVNLNLLLGQQMTFNIYKGPNFLLSKTLDFETFVKPTNRQAYVHATSFHPPGVSKVVAIGEMKLYLRTNSLVDSFNNFKTKHRTNLLKRGYSSKFVDNNINRVKFLDCSFELNRNIKQKNNWADYHSLQDLHLLPPQPLKSLYNIGHT